MGNVCFLAYLSVVLKKYSLIILSLHYITKLRIFTNGYRNKTNRALCAKMYTNSKGTCIAKANLEFTGKIINMKSNYL